MREPRRHPHHALTSQKVQALKPSVKAKRVADGGGLYVLITPRGTKSWVVRTIVKGKRCDIGVGSVELVVSRGSA